MSDAVAKIGLALEGHPVVVAGLQQVQAQFSSLKGSVASVAAGLAAGFTVGAFVNIVKGAVESGAALHDLALQTGSTVEALSGLAAVGRYSDQTADTIGGAMNKLTKNLASTTEESKGAGLAIQALGLGVSQFKQLRPEDQMQALAKAMGGFADGADKAAVMMALYGKEGAKMLPFMADLAVAGDLAAEVTTEQANAADNLDDNLLRLRTSGDAWKKELANAMIPALDEGVQALLGMTNGSGGLRDEVRRLAADGSIAAWTRQAITGASYVIDVFEGVVRVVKSVGIAIGATLAAAAVIDQATAAATTKAKAGDLSGAWDELAGAARQTKTIMSDMGADMDKLWSQQSKGQQFRAALDRIAAGAAIAGNEGEKAKPKLDFQNVLAKNAAGAKASDSVFRSMMKTIEERLAASEQELKLGRELTDIEKFEVKVKTDLIAAGDKLTLTERQIVLAKLAEVKASTELLALRTAERAFEMNRAKYLADLSDETHAMVLKNAELREEIDLLGKDVRTVAEYAQAKMDAAIATKEQKLAAMQLLGATADETAEIVRQIAILKERQTLVGLKQQGEEALEQQRAQRDMWKSIDTTAHDVFVNIFEDGAGTFKRLGQTLKAALLDMLYQMTIKRWIISIAASVTGVAPVAAAAVAGQGGGGGGIGIGDVAGAGLNMFGGSLFGAGGLTGALMGGAGWVTGATTLAGSLTAAGSLIGTGTLGGIASGVGMAIGAAMPVLLPIALLAMGGAFSRKHKQHNLEGTFGGATGFEGNWHDYYKGGLFRSSKTTDTPLEPAFLQSLQQAWKLQEAAVRGYADTLGLATDQIDSYTYAVNLKLKDIDAKDDASYQQAVMERVNEAIRTGSNELAEQLLGTWTTTTAEVERTIAGIWMGDYETASRRVIETVTTSTYVASEYARQGELAIDTLTRLATSLQGVNGAFDTLGFALLDASLAGGDLASLIADATGGLERFGQLTASYWQDYYDDAERAATIRRQLGATLGSVGLDLPATRAELRAMVEALVDSGGLLTDAGRAQFNALMSVQGAFAQITPAADAAADAVGDVATAIEQAFAGADALASTLSAALLGRFEHEGLTAGQAMADIVTGGIYDAIAGNFAQRITSMMVQGVVEPMIQAALTGTVVSQAVSQAAIDKMLADATATAQALGAVLGDPAFQAALQQINAQVAALGDQMARSAPYHDSYADQWARQAEAQRLAQEAARAAADAAADAARAAKDAAEDAARAAEQAYDAARGSTDRVWGELQKFFDRSLQAARALADEASAIQSLTGDRKRSLRGEMADTRALAAAQGRAYIDDALRQTLTGGALPSSDKLGQAIDAAVAGLDVNQYASVAQYEVDKAILAAKLGALEEGAGLRLTDAEQQIGLLEQQVQHYQQLIDVQRGMQTTVTSIDDGIAQLVGLLAAETAARGAAESARNAAAALPGANPVTGGGAFGGGGGAFGGGGATTVQTALQREIAAIRGASWYGNGDWSRALGWHVNALAGAIGPNGVDAADMAARIYDEGFAVRNGIVVRREVMAGLQAEMDAIRAGGAFSDWRQAQGWTLDGLAGAMGVNAQELDAFLRQRGMGVEGGVVVPAFANGGLHAGGVRLVGERGPEVEFTGPARYYSFEQSQRLIGGGGHGDRLAERLESENRALRREVAALAAKLDRVAAASELTARVLDRVTSNGNAMRTEEA